MMKMFFGLLCGIMAAELLAGSRTADFSKFGYESRGAPWEVIYNMTIDFGKRILTTQVRRHGHRDPKPEIKTISLTPEQVAELKKTLNRAGVICWKDKYVRKGVNDGTFWDASYVLSDGTSRVIHGDNAWPDGIDKLSAALKQMGVEFIK